VLPLREAERTLRERTEKGREEMARAQAEPALAAAGIDFDLKDPLISSMLEGMGVQIAYITEDVRQQIMGVIQSGYDEGLTIDQIVKQLRGEVAGMSAMRASRIARTELLTAKNGASWASCKVTGAAGYKQWMATVDSKTRSTHIDVSGQVRNIDKAFDVGFGRASYPGDPSLPPEERVNCRCTIVYSDDPGGVPGVPRSSDIEAGRGVWEMGRSSVRGTLRRNLRIRTRGVPR
jgi:SPP1 gp7 family putative phage head morphogenesis protein